MAGILSGFCKYIIQIVGTRVSPAGGDSCMYPSHDFH